MWNGHKHICEDVVIIYANLDSIWSFFSDIYFYYLYRERFEVNLHAKRWENVKWFNVAEEQVFSLFSSEDEQKMSIPREFLKTNFKNFELSTHQQLNHFLSYWCFPKRFPSRIRVRCKMPLSVLVLNTFSKRLLSAQ